MKDKKVVWFAPFRRVRPEDFEQWMEDMEAQGWHISRLGQWQSIAMTFQKSEPQKYRYVYDMQAFPRKDYRQTFEAFGWEFVGQMASAHIWRKAYTDVRPEAFSDRTSKVQRDMRNFWAASVSFFMFLLVTLVIFGVVFLWPDAMIQSDRVHLVWFGILCGVLTALMGIVLYTMKRSKRKP